MSNNNITQDRFEAFVRGDENAFRQIISSNSLRLFTFVFKMTKSRLDTEEIVQDVFYELWEKRSEMKAVHSFYGYMFSSARFRSLNYYKKHHASYVEMDENLAYVKEYAQDIESHYEAAEMILLIADIVEQMPDQRRRVFTMSRVDGFKRGEIAEKLQISPNTVSTHLTEAMVQIKKVLIAMSVFLSLFEK